MVGGSDVSVGTWPWHVAILSRINSTAPFRHHCEGTIIHEEWIVTAASCLYKPEHVVLHDLKVKAGTANLQENSPDMQERGATQIIRHPNFSPVSLQDNIALLKLSSPLTLTNTVNAICMPDNVAVRYSFGTCHTTGYDESGVLQEVWVHTIPWLRCNMETWWNFRVSMKMLCAGRYEGRADGCEINLGGPLSCFQLMHDRYYLCGIRILGDQCGVPRKPNIYLKTTSYFLWVEKYVPLHYN
ncbi:plasminogen-like [Trichomycterus rosablanca]|uniref:plasminogen-like n=1 Tax=Trichomycterus rosablanca TaxID=2290929 RepID=UPI002F359EE6